MFFVPSVFLCFQVQFIIYYSVFAEETTIPSEAFSNKPVNLTIGKVTNTTINLSWNRPEKPSGDIIGYQLHYMYGSNYHATKNVNVTSAKVHYTLSNLTPFTEYKIWVESSIMGDGDNGSEYSEEILQCTDVSGPGPPRITNVTCLPHNNSFYVQWQKPTEFFNTIDIYLIFYKSVDEEEFEEIRYEPYTEELEEIVSNLQDNTVYEVKVSGASRSVLNSKSLMQGVSSEPKLVFIKSDCDQPEGMKSSRRFLSVLFVSVSLIFCFFVIFTICAVAIWRHCFHAAYYYLEESRQVVTAPAFDWDAKNEEYPPVPVEDFPKHVAALHADGDIGFSKEYESIQCSTIHDQFSSEVSTHPENKLKNRYLNILAYDHSRVRLMAGPGQNRWVDYINANYIDGFEKINAYIGTQGPLPNTFDCFWRMVWEQGVSVIVMITNLVERGRRKCDMYWPKEGSETYGHIQVKLIKEDVLAMYTVRTMKITHLKAKRKKYTSGERLVHQFHYTNWHDHGTPDHPLPILSFVSKSSSANEGNSGPIVVHCSAGVGRTGTYIVLDAMLKQIRARKEVNIYGYLRYIRNQRNYLVQTEEQYIFIHDAILEAITFAENTLSTECLQYILQPNVDTDSEYWQQFESNYTMVTAFEAKDYNHTSANKLCNVGKNRSQEFVPLESSRVHLTPKPGIEGSDYINASWFLGFKKLKEFIITQHPMDHTIVDFWQMIWDHNAQTVVLLSAVDEGQSYPPFWPSEKNSTLDSDNFKVKSIEESELDGTVSRDFTIQSLHDDYELTVRIIHPSHTITEIADIIQLIIIVQQYHLEYQNGPIVVVDDDLPSSKCVYLSEGDAAANFFIQENEKIQFLVLNFNNAAFKVKDPIIKLGNLITKNKLGGTVSASFCCLTTLMKQLEYDSHADVSIYAKLYHNRIPGIWKTIDDYLVLYKGLSAITTSKGVSLVASPSYVNSS